MNLTTVHVPALLQETIDGLHLGEGMVVFDGTAGGGGHARLICEKIGPGGHYIGVDLDISALERTKHALQSALCKKSFIAGSYRDLDSILAKEGVSSLDACLFDLGFSSDQLEQSGRGFSFLRDEPLSMSYRESSPDEALTAYDIVNTFERENLLLILKNYGEEKFSERIVNAILEARRKAKIESTFDLVRIIEGAVPAFVRKGKQHPATKTFQAIRMAVNDELTNIRLAIPKAFDLLKAGGRMGVITFHSLEDRIVKNIFRDFKRADKGKVGKIVKPAFAEVKHNPRARSAKLRIIEKI